MSELQELREEVLIISDKIADLKNEVINLRTIQNETGADNSRLITELTKEKKDLQYQVNIYIDKLTNLEKQAKQNDDI